MRRFPGFVVQGDLVGLADSIPTLSGYGDEMGNGAHDACVADLDARFGSIGAPRITRLTAMLPHSALNNDLTLQASADQSVVDRTLSISNDINAPCEPASGSGASAPSGATGAGAGSNGAGASNAATSGAGAASNAEGSASGGGCACSFDGSRTPLDVGLAALALAAFARRRRGVRGGSASSLRT